MDLEQIWAQLEFRNQGIIEVIKRVGPMGVASEDGDAEDMSSGEEDEDDDSGDSEDSMEDMTEEEFREMMMRGDLGDSEEDEEEDEDDDEGLSEEEDKVEFYENEDGEDDQDDQEQSEEGSVDGDESLDGFEGGEMKDEGGDALDDEEDALDDEVDAEESQDGSDIDMDADGGDEIDDRAALFGVGEAGPSQLRSKRSHPTLDDDFFSIDEFNRLTEEAEAGRTTSGRLGGVEDDEDEDLNEDIGGLMLGGAVAGDNTGSPCFRL